MAEYAGQTGPKTNQCVDEAIDGLLFIDEAYSLVSADGDDPFGKEALQTLLKRMEDDRDRLVVVLAGYPKPMEQLVSSNPGLSSRFNRTLQFTDYQPVELCEIYERFANLNHYELAPKVRARLLIGAQHLFEQRDEHFGNGRLMRNVFEDAIRHLANRLSSQAEITHESLTRFLPEDIRFPGWTDALDTQVMQAKFAVVCPGCKRPRQANAETLGRRVRCNNCQHEFRASWGHPRFVD